MKSHLKLKMTSLLLALTFLSPSAYAIKMGESIGKGLGKVSNPIKDRITKPLVEYVLSAGNQDCLVAGGYTALSSASCIAALLNPAVSAVLAASVCGTSVHGINEMRRRCS